MDCPKCGAHNETDVGSCLSCGASFAAEDAAAPTMMKPAARAPAQRLQQPGGPPKQCPNCMTLNAASFKFCARCGTPLTPGAAAPPPKVAGWPVARPDAKPAAGAVKAPQPPVSAPSSAKPAAAPSAARPGSAGAAAPRPAPAARPSPPPPPKPGPGTRPPAPAAPSKAGKPRARARISAIARDGSRSADYVLTQPETRIGRAVGEAEVKLDKDQFVAAAHAVFKYEGDQLTVEDGGTENGVFLWFKERQIQSGDELRIGRQRLRIEWLPEEPETPAEQPLWGSPDPGYVARAVQLLEGGGEGDVFPLKQGENLVGRGSGDVSFPQDGYVSSRHCVVTVGDGQIGVKDLGSANGTFVKINGSAVVAPGDLLLVGEQILRVDPA
jgi:pSer/pThr/pTyr-binding forkhead associated (FHA) protein